MKRIASMLLSLCLITMCAQPVAASANTPETAGSDLRTTNMQISEIIDNVDNTNVSDKMSAEEIDEFLDDTSGSKNALLGKSEEEIEAYFDTVYCGKSAADNTNGGLITNPVTYLHNTVDKKTDKYVVQKTKTWKYNMYRSWWT